MTLHWIEQTTSTTPAPRYTAGMCHVPGVGTFLVGGTNDGSTGLPDAADGVHAATWLYPTGGSNWTKLAPATEAIAGFGGGLAFDPDRNVLVWVPGFNTSYVSSAYDEFDLTAMTWTHKTSVTSFGAVWGQLVYDKHRMKMVLFSGYSTFGTYELNPATHDFVGITTTHNPGNYAIAMAFDEVNHNIVGFGNASNTFITYLYDGTDWTFPSPASAPSSGIAAFLCMIWNAFTSLILLLDMTDSTANWSWDGTNWTTFSPTAQTFPHNTGSVNHASGTYDQGVPGFAIFGGQDQVGATVFSDLWFLEGDSPPPPPTPIFVAPSSVARITISGLIANTSVALLPEPTSTIECYPGVIGGQGKKTVVAGTRARYCGLFKKDGVVFDPQEVLYSATFTPATTGLRSNTTQYTYNVDAQVIRASAGYYQVVTLIDGPGMLKFTWRSTAFGEEINVEEIVAILPRTVVV